MTITTGQRKQKDKQHEDGKLSHTHLSTNLHMKFRLIKKVPQNKGGMTKLGCLFVCVTENKAFTVLIDDYSLKERLEICFNPFCCGISHCVTSE